MRFNHNIWIGFRIYCLRRAAPMRVTPTATTFTVSWNWTNFLIESYIFLPHSTAFTIESKLSSSNMIAEAYLATYVPLIPIAKPTSAFFKAGASLVPSPVTATTLSFYLSPVTRAYLSSGLDRAKTRRFSVIYLKTSAFFIVSTLTSSDFKSLLSAYFELMGQSHLAVWHFLQITPPIF